MEKKENKIEELNPVHKEWLIAVEKQELEQPKVWTDKEIDNVGPVKPKSKLQGYIQDIYETLIEASTATKVSLHDKGDGDFDLINTPSEDYFDKWYENNDIEKYNQKYNLLTVLNSIAHSVGKSSSVMPNEEGFQEVLSSLAIAVLEEQDGIMLVAEAINNKYPRLAEEPMKYIPADLMSGYEQDQYDKEVAKIEESIETNIDKYRGKLKKLEEAAKTDFEEIATILNRIVIFGEAMWELMLYAVMSPKAPKVLINSMLHRANIHGLLAGDISTAKSKILEICSQISPKAITVDETTSASLRGVATIGDDEIGEGVLDHASGGNIIIEELTTQFSKMPLWRRAMDCKILRVYIGGKWKTIDVNTTVLAACNPQADFFQEETMFRSQIGFKEGVLSRFDVLIPLTASTMMNMIIVDKLNLFGQASADLLDLSDVKERMSLIGTGMETIKRVVISAEQQEMLRDVFKQKNALDDRRRLLKNRPYVLLRDLETLARLVNVIASVNFANRVMKAGILHADDEDIGKAIRLWENLMHMRVQLYGMSSRILLSPSDEIVKFVFLSQKHTEDGYVPLSDALNEIVGNRQLISQRTFYREIEKMKNGGRIVVKGKRNMKVSVVIT